MLAGLALVGHSEAKPRAPPQGLEKWRKRAESGKECCDVFPANIPAGSANWTVIRRGRTREGGRRIKRP